MIRRLLILPCLVFLLGFATCSRSPPETSLPSSPFVDADETIDFGELHLDADQPLRLAPLRLFRHKIYRFTCRGLWTEGTTRTPNVLSLSLLQKRSHHRPWSIGSAALRRITDNNSEQPVTYEGVLKRVNRNGEATLQLKAGESVIMEREVVIGP